MMRELINEMNKALKCLELEAPYEVVKDVAEKVANVVEAFEVQNRKLLGETNDTNQRYNALEAENAQLRARCESYRAALENISVCGHAVSRLANREEIDALTRRADAELAKEDEK